MFMEKGRREVWREKLSSVVLPAPDLSSDYLGLLDTSTQNS